MRALGHDGDSAGKSQKIPGQNRRRRKFQAPRPSRWVEDAPDLTRNWRDGSNQRSRGPVSSVIFPRYRYVLKCNDRVSAVFPKARAERGGPGAGL